MAPFQITEYATETNLPKRLEAMEQRMSFFLGAVSESLSYRFTIYILITVSAAKVTF